MANKERIGITNVLKAIASKVMESTLGIYFRMQKSTFKHKGKIHATLRVEFNALDPFFNKQHFRALSHKFFNSFHNFSSFHSIFHEFFFFFSFSTRAL